MKEKKLYTNRNKIYTRKKFKVLWTGVLDEVDWNWNTGLGRMKLEQWMRQTAWNQSTGLDSLEQQH